MKSALFLGLLVMLLASQPASGEENCNALVTAAAHCDHSAVRILLDAGISPNCRADADQNFPGSTAPWSFISSKCQGSGETLEMFIAKGYDVNLQNIMPGNKPSSTALHAAATVGNTEAVQILLGRGADPTIKNQDNMTALDYAVRFEHSSVVALLVSHENGLRKKGSP
jgi:ankyrin repeat protein